MAMNFLPRSFSAAIAAFALAIAGLAQPIRAAETAAPAAVPARADETSNQDIMRAYLQVQEQLRATQLALEKNRRDTDESATRNAQALLTRMQAIEQSLVAQRTQELETVQSSYRLLMVASVAFASVGFLALLLTAYFQGRTANRLAAIASALPAMQGYNLAPAVGALGPVEPSSTRLLGAIHRLEKRIYELEHTSRPPLAGPASSPHLRDGVEAGSNGGDANSGNRIGLLLAKGQSLLSLDKPEEALACFDEVLELEQGNTDALLKKGEALERLRKLEQAIECYNRAIAMDSSLTIAYLHKGGLYNRLEKFDEAVECYEQALRTQEKRAAEAEAGLSKHE